MTKSLTSKPQWRTDVLPWPQHIAEKRKAKQEAEAAEREPTLQAKLDLAVERVFRGTATKAQTVRHVRSPDVGLSRFFELIGEIDERNS